MTASSHGRKRGRSPSSNCDECLPISKRINKLHIQPSQRSSIEDRCNFSLPNADNCGGSGQNSPEDQFPWQQPLPGNTQNPDLQDRQYGNSNPVNTMPFMSSQDGRQSDQEHVHKLNVQTYAQAFDIPAEDLSGYKPEIAANENPHYFRINNILYDAHIERAARHGRFYNNNN